VDRRDFVCSLAAGAAVTAFSPTSAVAAAPKATIKAVAFDAFAIFDARPVFALAAELFPGQGAELGNVWRAHQFDYAWLRTLSGRYVDFWRVTEDALVFSCRSLKLELTGAARDRLMQSYLEIKAWPDVMPAMKTLKDAAVRMTFLSNFTGPMLDRGVKNSGLEGFFEEHFSTDRVKAYKPDPRAYAMATSVFGLRHEEIAFAAFAGWDAAGAKWFGYPTFWLNRMGAPAEELGVAPDAVGKDLGELVRFVAAQKTG
jgi:2-haloacid dehalogenase